MQILPLEKQYDDLFEALDFVTRRVKDWQRIGIIRPHQEEDILDRLEKRKQKWRQHEQEAASMLSGTGLPTPAEGESPAAKSLRYWIFLAVVVERMQGAGNLTLRQGHQLTEEVAESASYLRKRMDWAELARIQGEENKILGRLLNSPGDDSVLEWIPLDPPAEQVGVGNESAPAMVQPAELAPRPRERGRPLAPSRSILEILIDPRNLQWLMAAGGALMAVGIVILLWVNKLFTPPTLAIVMGGVNLTLLGIGWWVLRSTSKHLAGRGLTLLACLLMPLNLWYYHANDLVTLSGGLWLGGLVIALLYLVSALILRDEIFVYVFSAGITMTCMLFLASLPTTNIQYWKVALPAVSLVALGLAGIHLERVFPEGEGPFTRGGFGLAFFWSGHVLLWAGLVITLIAQIIGDWLYDLVFPNGLSGALGDGRAWRELALGIFVAGTYAYLYSDIVVRKIGVYAYAGAVCFVCALVVALRVIGLPMGLDVWMIVFAVVALAVNVAWSALAERMAAVRPLPWIAVVSLGIAVLLGFTVYARAISIELKSVWAVQAPGWSYVAALAVAVVSGRAGAFLMRRDAVLTGIYFFLTGAATLLGATAILASLGMERWTEHALLLMVVPILYLLAAWMYGQRSPAKPLLWVSHAAVVVMLVSSLASAFEGFAITSRDPLNLVLAGFFGEAMLFYFLAMVLHRQEEAVYGVAAMLAAAVWQLLTYMGLSLEVYILTFAALGLLMLIGYRLDFGGKLERGPWAKGLFQSANTFLSIALIVALFYGLVRLNDGQITRSLAGLYAALSVVCLLALVLLSQRVWRRWYLAMSLSQAFFCFLALVALTELTGWQKLELFCVFAGLVLLILGHVGWIRERERENDLVTLELLFGSMLLCFSLAIATLFDRASNQFRWGNELGFLAASVLLLVSGVFFRLRSTTIVGAIFCVIYFVTLLIFVPWGRLNTIALFITIGGGAIFLLGLTLSLFRDRLVMLAEQIKRREGVFQVLTWR